MALTESGDRRIWREYMGLECAVCEKKKSKAQSFCSSCYYKLPEGMRKSLYRRFGDGYEEAYEEAIDELGGRKSK